MYIYIYTFFLYVHLYISLSLTAGALKGALWARPQRSPPRVIEPFTSCTSGGRLTGLPRL